MEKYIAGLIANSPMPEIDPVGNGSIPLDSVKWNSFKIEEIFEVKTESFILRLKEAKGSIPFVIYFVANNGVKSFFES